MDANQMESGPLSAHIGSPLDDRGARGCGTPSTASVAPREDAYLHASGCSGEAAFQRHAPPFLIRRLG
jgi:hypothetical protein